METANIKQNISNLEIFITDMHKNLRDSKNYAENTRSEIVIMETNVNLLIEDTPKVYYPQIKEISTDFHQEVKNQRDLSDYFQKQLTELKKENSIIHQRIIGSITKSTILEDSVGINLNK